MLGWRVGERPDLLLDNEDDEIDNEIGPVDHCDLGRMQWLVLPSESVAVIAPIPFPVKKSRS